MAEQIKKTPYQQQIYNQMNLKETEELLAIWTENDPEAWTDEAFEQIRIILQERLGEVPEQDDEEDDITEMDEDIERGYLGSFRAFRIAYWLKTASWVVAAYAAVRIFTQLYYFVDNVNGVNIYLLLWTLFINILGELTNSGFIYLLLLASSEILYLLEDIHWLLMPENKEDAA